MSKKQLSHLLLFLLLSAFLSTGCAHKPVTPSLTETNDSAFHQNKQIETAKVEQVPPSPGSEDDSNENFIEDKLDEFDDEFEEEKVEVSDPLEPWNRAMFHFNDKLYFWILKPIARGYKAVIPKPARVCVKNFFHNLTTPIRLVNSLLQGKVGAAGAEFGRFVFNSTVGILGFGNPARHYPILNPVDEDLGQTLGNYGLGNGPYIVWPILGPSTLRDSIGLAGDWFLNPVSYVEPTEASLGIKGYEIVNETSLRIGEYESIKKASLEPYVAIRDGYIQYRTKKVEE
jgi:phospholipid-binding lipoprotein MlaA